MFFGALSGNNDTQEFLVITCLIGNEKLKQRIKTYDYEVFNLLFQTKANNLGLKKYETVRESNCFIKAIFLI